MQTGNIILSLLNIPGKFFRVASWVCTVIDPVITAKFIPEFKKELSIQKKILLKTNPDRLEGLITFAGIRFPPVGG